jgi:hypothetical protein
MTLEQRGQALLDRALSANAKRRAHLASDARALANSLHREGVGLCMDKATEFSPRIRVLFRLASKLAAIGYGPDAPELKRFERGLQGDDAGQAQLQRLRARLD